MVKSNALITAFIGLLCLLSINPAQARQQAYIKLELDSGEVYAGDTVVLHIESTGLLDPIDFSLIEKQAEIIRQTTGTRIAVYSGKVVEIAIRRMDVVPISTGVMVIGPLTSGDISSNSVSLNVLDAERPDWQPQADDLQINTTLAPETAVPNQKVALTIELLHRYPISNESVTLPALNGFSKRLLIENRRTYQGPERAWLSTVWEYLIFPESSGAITIEGVSWSGTTARSRIERADFTRQSPTLTLPVASPNDSTMAWWLPATSVTLTEEWSQPPTELRAGDELNRIIRVEATSVLAGQIPTLTVPESRAVKQTLINTRRQEKLTANGVIASAEFTYRVKAQSPIPVFLDTIRLPWWNTNKDAATQAIIPARRINVGLPDRADVLSKLALQETGINRVKFWLQSTGWFRILSAVVGTLSGGYLLWTLLPALLLRWKHYQSQKRYASQLRALVEADAYHALYQQLQRTESQYVNAPPAKQLKLTLEAILFSAQDGSIHLARSHKNVIKKLLDDSLKKPDKVASHSKQENIPSLARL